MGATYGPVTILCALVDLQVKQSVVTKRHGMQRLRYLRGGGGMGIREARRAREGKGWVCPHFALKWGLMGKFPFYE